MPDFGPISACDELIIESSGEGWLALGVRLSQCLSRNDSEEAYRVSEKEIVLRCQTAVRVQCMFTAQRIRKCAHLRLLCTVDQQEAPLLDRSDLDCLWPVQS